ncbi:MAG: carbohydrate kinase family protein [Peptoniphilaceae bacterium]|nr:carbohydrate kinase family protein [Peptoniphilaceae bacterium]
MTKGKKKKIVVGGHACIDITPSFHNPPISHYDQIFIPGTLVDVGEAKINPGGCVSNTGLALNFMGADVHLMGRVGDDAFGKLLMDSYEKKGARVTWSLDRKHSTGYTIVLSPNGMDRMFLHGEGTSAYTNNKDFSFNVIKEADLFHFGYPSLLPVYQKEEGAELIKLYQKVKSFGVVTSLDLAMLDRSSEGARQDWNLILQRLLPYVDIFVPSFDELLMMINPLSYDHLLQKADGKELTKIIEWERDIYPLAQKVLSYGVKVLLIKCGTKGLFCMTQKGDIMKSLCEKMEISLDSWSNRRVHQKSFVADRVMSATGAGDTSIAAFLYSITLGLSLEEALEYAAAQGASCVTEYDSLSGLLSMEDLRKKISSGWETHE